jgi:COMM domain containing 9
LLCLKCVLGSGELNDLVELFQDYGTDVNPKLKQLIGQLISHKLEIWKDASISNRVSLPRYLDLDWTLNVQKSSSEVTHLNIPSLLLELSLEPTPQTTDGPSSVEKISFELSREALETVLDGLGRIRDQLGAMG